MLLKDKSKKDSQVTDIHGMTYYDETSISFCFTQFYRDLFTSSKPSQIDICLSTLHLKLTVHMNALLCKPFFIEEVKSVVFQMGPNKAPRQDGYGKSFYQHHQSL